MAYAQKLTPSFQSSSTPKPNGASHEKTTLAKLLDDANHLRRRRDFANAVVTLNKAIGLYPHEPRLWRDLGSTFLGARAPEHALRCFKKAHDMAPQDLDFALTYANRLRKHEQFALAEQTLLPFVRTCQKNPEKACRLFEVLGQVYYEAKETNLAAVCVEYALSLGSTHSVVKSYDRRLRKAALPQTADIWDSMAARCAKIIETAGNKGASPTPQSP